MGHPSYAHGPRPLSPRLLLAIELSAVYASIADVVKLGNLVRECRESVVLWVMIAHADECKRRRTHLMHAALQGDTPRVHFLLGIGSTVNTSTHPIDGAQTALWLAADAGHDVTCDALLKAGANPALASRAAPDATLSRHRSREFVTPLERATLRGRVLATRVLLPASPPHIQSNALLASVFLRDTTLVREFCVTGCHLDKCDGSGRTPMIIAAGSGQFDVIRLLCASGARTDIPDDGGILPLAEAARSGNVRCLLALLDWGANIDARCGPAGRSALWWAACAGQILTAGILVRHGADCEKPATLGLAPFEVALAVNAPEVATEIRNALAERTRLLLTGAYV